MIILVVGTSYSAKRLSDTLSLDKNNVVFTTANSKCSNKIDLSPYETNELKDFILANEVNFLIVADKNYIDIDYNNLLCDTECVCLCPEYLGAKLSCNLYSGKKFAYKNKIRTPKFTMFEKLPSFLDFVKSANMPITIMPETINSKETSFIAETKDSAKNYADKLFQTGNKKILAEEYIHGYKYTKYLLLNNSSIINLFDTISYFDEVSTNNTIYIPQDAKNKIEKEIIPNILNGVHEEEINYTGILGITLKISKDEIYFSNFEPFFNDLDIDIFLNIIEENIANLFYDCAIENSIKDIKTNLKYVITTDHKGEIIYSCGNTMHMAIKNLEYDDVDTSIINEAVSNWKK